MKQYILLFISLILIIVSLPHSFSYLKEYYTEYEISERYIIEDISLEPKNYNDNYEYTLSFSKHTIKLTELNTGVKAPLTMWDEMEEVEAGDIIEINILLDGNKITSSDIIWSSNRDTGSRYFSWLGAKRVYDKLTQKHAINIVQRLSDDNAPMADRQWKLVTINNEGVVTSDKITLENRNENPLAVKLINLTNTSLKTIGYYSDITQGYPSMIFPLVYPFSSLLIGILFFLFFLSVIVYRKLNK